MAYTKEITIQDIQEAIHKFDLIEHPYIIYCHPSDKEMLVEALGDAELIEDIPLMEKGKVLMLDRAKYEEEEKEFYKSFVECRDIGKDDTNSLFTWFSPIW